MNYLKAAKLMREFEEKEDIWSLQIGGVYIWPLVKYMVFEKMVSYIFQRPFLSLVFFRLRQYKAKDIFISYFDLKKKVDGRRIAFSQPNARRMLHGRQYDFHFDPGAEKHRDFIIYEWPTPRPHFSNNATPPSQLRYLDYLSFKIDVQTLLWSWAMKIVDVRQDLLPKAEWDRIVRHQLCQFCLYEKEYSKFFRKNPKVREVCFRVNSNVRHIALVTAARKCGVKSIEFQHGQMSGYCPEYIYPKTLLNPNKSWPFPDEIKVFSRKTIHLLRKESRCFNRTRLVPYDYLQGILEKYSSVPGEETFRKIGLKPMHRERRKILISSQWIKREELKEFAARLLEKEEIRKGYVVLYKLHPAEIHGIEIYDTLRQSDNFYLIGSDISVYELFNICDVHSSYLSSCIMESLYAGIPNIIFESEDADFFGDIRGKEGAFFAGSADSYIRHLKKIERMKDVKMMARKTGRELHA